MEQIRRETLIILAFAAGLLSEKAYLYVEKIAGKKLDAQEEARETQKLEQQARIEQPESGHIKPQSLSNEHLPQHNQAIEIEPSLPEMLSSGDSIQIEEKDGSSPIEGANERIKELEELKNLLKEGVESTQKDLKP